jgi:hypothetical protein
MNTVLQRLNIDDAALPAFFACGQQRPGDFVWLRVAASPPKD